MAIQVQVHTSDFERAASSQFPAIRSAAIGAARAGASRATTVFRREFRRTPGWTNRTGRLRDSIRRQRGPRRDRNTSARSRGAFTIFQQVRYGYENGTDYAGPQEARHGWIQSRFASLQGTLDREAGRATNQRLERSIAKINDDDYPANKRVR